MENDMTSKECDVIILEGDLIVKKINHLILKKCDKRGIIANIKFLITVCRELKDANEDLCIYQFMNEEIDAEKQKLGEAIRKFSEFITMNYPL